MKCTCNDGEYCKSGDWMMVDVVDIVRDTRDISLMVSIGTEYW